MENSIISIIVPVYNVEKYLEKCVSSLCNQTYTNIEIILIDDGSTDNSGLICDKLKKIDNRIVTVHKQNEGLSSARNEGIKLASGKLIAFVDSDDYISNDMIELLYNNLVKYNADISVCGYTMIYHNKSISISNNDKVIIYDKVNALKRMFLKNDIGMIFCNKLFKRELFKDIKFPLFQNFEDINTMYKIIDRATIIVYDPLEKYYYIQREDSINGNNFRNKKFNNKIYDLYNATYEVYSFIERKYPEILYEASIGCINNLLRVNNQLIIHKVNDKDIELKTKILIKKNLKNIFYDKQISLLRKIQYFLFLNLNSIYKLIIKIIK